MRELWGDFGQEWQVSAKSAFWGLEYAVVLAIGPSRIQQSKYGMQSQESARELSRGMLK